MHVFLNQGHLWYLHFLDFKRMEKMDMIKKDDRSVTILVWVLIFIIACMFGFICYQSYELGNVGEEKRSFESRCENYESLRETDVEDMKEYIYEIWNLSESYNKMFKNSSAYDLIFEQPTYVEEYTTCIPYYPLIYGYRTYNDAYLSMQGRIVNIEQQDYVNLIDVAIDGYDHQVLTVQESVSVSNSFEKGDYVQFYGQVSFDSVFDTSPDIICDYIKQIPEPEE